MLSMAVKSLSFFLFKCVQLTLTWGCGTLTVWRFDAGGGVKLEADHAAKLHLTNKFAP